MFQGSTRSKAYQVLAKAQELCKWRLKAIEIELADAFHELHRPNPYSALSRDHKTALCMAHHERLGRDSPLACLPDDLLRQITAMAEPV